MRPQRIEDVVGQEHLLAPGAPLGAMIREGHLASMILWGPPGCGKTTLARLLAGATAMAFIPLSAVFSGVADLKKVFAEAASRRRMGEGTLLFVDEIHRFNRAQQDAFLPVVEDGTITLIGATTENPSFELNSALLSRCRVFILRRLDAEALGQLIDAAMRETGIALNLTEDGRETLIRLADGDGRYLLNLVEALQASCGGAGQAPTGDGEGSGAAMDAGRVSQIVQLRAPVYDKGQDGHYNLISALHKSLRGSDPDAALYWLARMLAAGEDPFYILRRLVRFASEDIGLAEPEALVQALAARDAYHFLGSPEGELALAQAVIFLATAPKSNAVYRAEREAGRLARETGSLMPPAHILNAPTALMRDSGYGAGYAYDHDSPDAFSGQMYFPEQIARRQFYRPTDRGHERGIAERLERWSRLRSERESGPGSPPS